VIVAVLLLAVGALAAAAAHVSRSGTARGDIALRDPLPDRVTAGLTTPDVRPVAPLFSGGSSARLATSTDARSAAGAFVPGAAAANARRFDLVRDNRRGGSSYRDFAGERRRGGNSGGSSGGSGIGGGGGFGGGGGWGGVSGTAPATNAGRTGSTRAAGAPGQNRASRPGGGSGSNGAPAGGAVAATPGVVTGGVIATAPLGPVGSSPGPSPTPEPLTLLLVGSGLAGLYGARKHLAG
jgi:hypothetical protein